MKVSVAALAVLLVVAASSLAVANPTGYSPCCQGHYAKKIPKALVKSFFYTGGNCRLLSVVFIFKNGKQACADPTAKWAIDIVESLRPE